MSLASNNLGLIAGGSLNSGLLLGLVLFAAIAGGSAARLMRVPRVVGYLVAGVILRLLIAGVAVRSPEVAESLERAAGPLQTLKTLALGLIMFIIGNVFEVRHLRSVGSRIIRISAVEMLCVVCMVSTACGVLWWLRSSTHGADAFAAGLLLGFVALATDPAATVLVLREYDAKGPVSDTLLTLTAVNNIGSIVLFHLAFLILVATGSIDSTATGDRVLWLDILLTSVGSAVLGVVVGFLLSVLYSKVTLQDFLLIFFAVMLGLGAGADALAAELHLSFNFLLTCLFLGAVVTNITINTGPLYNAIQTMGAPVFAAFFVIAGYELHVEELTDVGLLGAVYVSVRVLGKYLGVRWGLRWAGWSRELSPHAGLGLLCQAGVAIGLADFLADAWVAPGTEEVRPHRLAAHFKTIVLGSIVVFELFGPVILKSVLKSAGEVKAITLLRRRRAATAEGESILRLTWDALLRTLGLGKTYSTESGRDLRVRHIMRSNIKFLHAAAKLDEVLHFVETSRYNHFPVVDEAGDFLGMVHFGDLRELIYDPHMRDLITAVDLACPDDLVPADMSLNDLLGRFRDRDVGSLVVVESAASRRVVGVVEQRDLLRVLHGEATATH